MMNSTKLFALASIFSLGLGAGLITSKIISYNSQREGSYYFNGTYRYPINTTSKDGGFAGGQGSDGTYVSHTSGEGTSSSYSSIDESSNFSMSTDSGTILNGEDNEITNKEIVTPVENYIPMSVSLGTALIYGTVFMAFLKKKSDKLLIQNLCVMTFLLILNVVFSVIANSQLSILLACLNWAVLVAYVIGFVLIYKPFNKLTKNENIYQLTNNGVISLNKAALLEKRNRSIAQSLEKGINYYQSYLLQKEEIVRFHSRKRKVNVEHFFDGDNLTLKEAMEVIPEYYPSSVMHKAPSSRKLSQNKDLTNLNYTIDDSEVNFSRGGKISKTRKMWENEKERPQFVLKNKK